MEITILGHNIRINTENKDNIDADVISEINDKILAGFDDGEVNIEGQLVEWEIIPDVSIDTERIKRRIKRLKKQLEKYNIENPQEKFNYFGGFDHGYIRGKIAALEDILDELNEEED